MKYCKYDGSQMVDVANGRFCESTGNALTKPVCPKMCDKCQQVGYPGQRTGWCMANRCQCGHVYEGPL